MPNQYKNKVIYGDSVLMDITDTTAEAGDVASGAVFYAKNGARTVGTFVQAQSDWVEDDNTDPTFILNKPPIIAGDGSYSTVENQINASGTTYTLSITGAANAKTFNYTTSDTIPSSVVYTGYADFTRSNDTHIKAGIVSIDTTNQTITLSRSLEDYYLTNYELKIYSGYHKALGMYSHVEGYRTDAIGAYSHAEGYGTKAVGSYAHSEGEYTLAIDMSSHAEGYETIAIGSYSHAEGYGTKADTYGHSEGRNTEATYNSHAEGYGTIANTTGQHVQGKYNISSSLYADIVGNGTADNARSNAYTLDWSGNGIFAGKVTVGAAPTNNMDVATKQYVDSAIPTVPEEVTIVTITEDTSTHTYSADKTFTEVYSALQSGAIVCAFESYSDSEYFYQCEFYTDSEINFVVYDLSFDQFANRYVMYGYRHTLKNDNTVERTTWYAPIPPESWTTPLSDGTAAVGTSINYARADHVHPKITQTISISNNVITLTGSDGSTSSVTLPVYNGGVTGVTGATGGSS